MIFKKSITAKFIAALFVVLLIGQSIGAVIFILFTRSELLESLEMRIKRAGNITAGVSSGPLLSFDYTLIDTYIEEIARDEEITAIHILDSKGKVVREKKKPAAPEVKRLNPFLFTKALSMKIPVTVGEEKVGEVVIDYTVRAINEDISKSMMIITLYQVMMLLSVGVVMMFLFNTNVKKPVARINRAIEKITMGDLTTDVPDLGENEIGSIAKGLRFLIERLSGTVMRFNSLSGNVLTAVGQLTTALRNVGEASKRQTTSIDGIVSAIRAANDYQKKSSENTDKLSRGSSENVSSLLEMKAVAGEIALSTGRLFSSTEDSYIMLTEMSQIAAAIAESAGEVSHAVENTSASVEEISASLNTVRDNTKKSSELTAGVIELLTGGTVAVADAIEAMEKIVTEVNYSAKIIDRLEERSKDIEKVLSVIKEVTEKTNLLSLNAAILAAQAGEYGKGFSVVADEIRSLSDRTSSSAKNIADIVRMIQTEIEAAVSAIRSGVKKVEDGKGLIFKSGEAMGETLEAARISSQMAKVVEKATEEQAEGLNQIRMSMENVRAMIEQVAKVTEEEKKGSSYMLESISEIKEVAELVKKGTEEHAVGTNVISKNLELTLDMVSQINQSAQNQLKTNQEIISAVEQMKHAAISAVRDMEEVTLSFGTLRKEVEVLKKETEIFRTGGVERPEIR